VRYAEEKFPLPFAVGFSLTMDPWSHLRHEDKTNSLVCRFESRHPRDFKEKMKIVGELESHDTIRLRAGYMDDYNERGLTAGLCLNKKISTTDFHIDYAFQDFGVFGDGRIFSFDVTY